MREALEVGLELQWADGHVVSAPDGETASMRSSIKDPTSSCWTSAAGFTDVKSRRPAFARLGLCPPARPVDLRHEPVWRSPGVLTRPCSLRMTAGAQAVFQGPRAARVLVVDDDPSVTTTLAQMLATENISSVAGKRGWANAAAYRASKFGLTGLTQAPAAEGKPHGIRACLVYPGGMATSWGVWAPGERSTTRRQAPAPTAALPPDEVAALIVWLAGSPGAGAQRGHHHPARGERVAVEHAARAEHRPLRT